MSSSSRFGAPADRGVIGSPHRRIEGSSVHRTRGSRGARSIAPADRGELGPSHRRIDRGSVPRSGGLRGCQATSKTGPPATFKTGPPRTALRGYHRCPEGAAVSRDTGGSSVRGSGGGAAGRGRLRRPAAPRRGQAAPGTRARGDRAGGKTWPGMPGAHPRADSRARRIDPSHGISDSPRRTPVSSHHRPAAPRIESSSARRTPVSSHHRPATPPYRVIIGPPHRLIE